MFELTHAVLPGMIRRKTGAICNVGSAAGNIPIPNNATYVLTKAGVNAFTEALHYELKNTGVSCTLLAPGPVRDAIIPENEKSIVDKVVPDVLWTTYESCAKETLEAMAKNRRRVVPGPLSKAMNVVSSVAPTRVLSPVMGWFYKKNELARLAKIGTWAVQHYAHCWNHTALFKEAPCPPRPSSSRFRPQPAHQSSIP